MIRVKSRLGPNPYVGGGFTVVFGEAERVIAAVAKCDRDDVLGVADTAYAVHATVTGGNNIVTIQVFSASTVGAGPNAWADLAAGNMAGRTFTVIALVE